jgi:hypothetical protein
MKMLKKLALVSAISMISAGSFAMEAMDDDTMSATTGQDGITIATAAYLATANTALTTANTSLTAANTSLTTANNSLAMARDAAAVVAGALDYASATAAQKAAADADVAVVAAQTSVLTAQIAVNDAQEDVSVKTAGVATATTNATNTGAMLNVKITTPSLRIQTGAIYVANSDAAASDEGVDKDGNAIAATTYDTDGATVSGKKKILDGMV